MEHIRHDADDDHGRYGRDGGAQRTAQRLARGDVHQLRDGRLLGQQRLVLTDTVVDDDGVVDGVAEDGQDDGHEVRVDLEAAEDEAAVGDDDVVQQGHDREHTGGPAGDLLESQRDVDDEQERRKDDGHDALAEELTAGGRADLVALEHLDIVVRVGLLHHGEHALLLLERQALVIGEGAGQDVGVGIEALALLEGDRRAEQALDLGLAGGLVEVAGVGVGYDGTALEVDRDLDAQEGGADGEDDQAGGQDEEHLLLAAEAKGLGGLVGLLIVAEEGRLLEGLEAGDGVRHELCGTDAHDEVEHDAGHEREAEGVDEALGGRAERTEDGGIEELGDGVGVGTEGAHQDDGHDGEGQVTVEDGREGVLVAGLDGVLDRLALGQLLLDTLGGDDVTVDAHTDRQDDTGDTGDGERGAGLEAEVAGNGREHTGCLADQADDGDEARYAVQHEHVERDEGQRDQTAHDHGTQRAGAEGRGQGLGAGGLEREGQRTGRDLVGELLGRLGGEVTGDDGAAVADGLVDGRAGNADIVHPDGDVAAVGRLRGSRGGEGVGAALVELELYDPLGILLVVARDGLIDARAGEDDLAVGLLAVAEGQLRHLAELVHGSGGIEVRLAGLPGETHDDAGIVVVDIRFAVVDVERCQAHVDDLERSVHLLSGRVEVILRLEGDIDTALDVDTEADVLEPVDIRRPDVTLVAAEAEHGRVGKGQDEDQHDEKDGSSYFLFHVLTSCDRPLLRGRAGRAEHSLCSP